MSALDSTHFMLCNLWSKHHFRQQVHHFWYAIGVGGYRIDEGVPIIKHITT